MTLFQLPCGGTVHGLNQNEVDYLYKEIFVDRIYVPEESFPLPVEPVVFDVGANIGLFTMFTLREWPNARVHAFEPIPQIYELLDRNVGSAAQTYQVAVGDTDGEVNLAYYPRYSMMSGMRADSDKDRARAEQFAAIRARSAGMDPDETEAVLANLGRLLQHRFEPVPVRCLIASLTTLVDELGVERIDLLKIDVEGAELDVVRGIDATTWARVCNAVVEVEDDEGALASIDGLFRENGFTTTSTQLADYCCTDLHLLYAWR